MALEPFQQSAALSLGVELEHNDARWLRERQAQERLLAEVVRQAAQRLRGQPGDWADV